MKKKISPKEILAPTLILFVIGAVAAALLGATNLLTKDKIASIDSENKAKAMSSVMEGAESFGESVIVSEDLEYSEALDENGNILGYAFTTATNGYGGDIQAMVGINLDGSISKVEILAADSETPGLGQNVKKSAFLDRFKGKAGELTVTKNAPGGDREIQAVTSATISSTAVTRAVNSALEYFENNLKGGNK